MRKDSNVSEIISFISNHPESNVSRRILRETLGKSPEVMTTEIVNSLRQQLEIADELVVEGYKYLVH